MTEEKIICDGEWISNQRSKTETKGEIVRRYRKILKGYKSLIIISTLAYLIIVIKLLIRLKICGGFD